MKILLDTNIILDIALRRLPHYDDSADVFRKIDYKTLIGCVTATTITDIYYIARKDKGHEKTIEFISNLIEIVDVLGIDRDVIIEALNLNFPDFEDAVQSVASGVNNIDYIITRNTKDFENSEIEAITPKDFLIILENVKN